ncbi:MAG: DUF1150 domain-containing protein [Pseudomonadota bacterium]
MTEDRTMNTTESVISAFELGQLGDGEIAYIRIVRPGEADDLFPGIEGIPSGISLYALTAADGTPLALTDSRSAALAHALEDELDVASVH